LLFSGVCLAQSNPWNGSWKLDEKTVQYEGYEFKMAVEGQTVTSTIGGEAQPGIVCDGAPHPLTKTVARTCSLTPDGMEATVMRDGVKSSTMVMTVNANEVSRKITYYPKDEPSYSITSIATRIGPGTGLTGTWKSTSVNESLEEPMTIAVHGDSIDFKETDQQKPTTLKLDGTPFSLGGTSAVSAKLEGSNTLKITYLSGGKPTRENTFILSADGKSIMETDVTPAPAPSTTKMTLNKM